MAQQDDGWPLGLRLVNTRVGFVNNGGASGQALSFNTLFSDSLSSSGCSSDLDTESSCSIFHDGNSSLGGLIDASSILELPRRSSRRRTVEILVDKKNYKCRPWSFALCSKLRTDAVSGSSAPSLGHFLEAERRAAVNQRRIRNSSFRGRNEPEPIRYVSEMNPLFIGDQVAPQSNVSLREGRRGSSNLQLSADYLFLAS